MSNSSRRRQSLMIGAVLLLVMIVVINRVGIVGPAGETSEDDLPSARSQYLARAAIRKEQVALIAQGAQWASAAARAEDVWSQTQRLLIEAPTVELAGARFRDRVVDELRMLGVEAPRATLVSGAAELGKNGDSPLRVIELDLRFDANSHRDLYSAIDRLENLPETWTAIEMVEVTGPGRIQVPHTVSVSLRLVAIGLIAAEARAEAQP